MLPDYYETKSKHELVQMIYDLRNAEIKSQNQITGLQSQLRGLEIALTTEQERSRLLAIENVQLLNKADPEKTRQYANANS